MHQVLIAKCHPCLHFHYLLHHFYAYLLNSSIVHPQESCSKSLKQSICFLHIHSLLPVPSHPFQHRILSPSLSFTERQHHLPILTILAHWTTYPLTHSPSVQREHLGSEPLLLCFCAAYMAKALSYPGHVTFFQLLSVSLLAGFSSLLCCVLPS